MVPGLNILPISNSTALKSNFKIAIRDLWFNRSPKKRKIQNFVVDTMRFKPKKTNFLKWKTNSNFILIN